LLLIFGITPKAEVIVKNLRNKKKNGSRTTIKLLNTDEYNLLMNFIRKENSLQRSLTSSTKLLKIILKPLSLRTCSDEGDTLSAVANYRWCWWNRAAIGPLCLCVCI
jgi:hypothetical protein